MSEKLQLGAIENETKKYTLPFQAEKGKVYSCADCNQRVILRKGTIRRAHFAHFSPTNTCTYYEHPNESQIHKDAKFLMQKMLNDKRLFYFKRDCINCGGDYAFQDNPSIDYKEGDIAVLEYRDPNNKWIADVALINNNEVRYIVEIKNTHSTVTPRPEPWFEVEAETFIKSVNQQLHDIENEKDSQTGERFWGDGKDYLFDIPCIRKELQPRCYGSFCYKEKWVRRIPGYDEKQADNSCILCKKTEYNPTNDGCTGRFQNENIRVCFDCLEKDTYEKKLREKYSNDIKVNIQPIIKEETTKIEVIPILIRRVGSENSWKQEKLCVNCGREKYSPYYENKKYYAICKICFSHDEENNRKLLDKVASVNQCFISDD
jgi:hypothetical protein